MPKFAVVVPCNNNADVVGETIASALASTHRDFVVVVTDNGSTDESAKVIDTFSDPRLIKHLHAGSVSKTDNWNRAYRDVPDCEYLVTLHGDDLLHPDALARLDAASARRPALIHGGLSLIEWDGTPIPRSGFPLDYRIGGKGFRALQLVSNTVGVAGATLRADLFDRIGGWDPDWTYMQDAEMWWQLAGLGDAVYLARPLGDYRIFLGRPNNPAFLREYRDWYGVRLAEAKGLLARAAIRANLTDLTDRADAVDRSEEYRPGRRIRAWHGFQRAMRVAAAGLRKP